MSISQENITLYQILSRFQLLPPGMVKQIQETQQQLLQQGKEIPLLQLLREYKVLSDQQLSWLLQVQQKGYLFCQTCSQAFAFPGGAPQSQYGCPKCKNNLLILTPQSSPSPSSSRDSTLHTPQTGTNQISTSSSRSSSLSVDLNADLSPVPRPGYHIQELLGKGGYGEVYRVEDPVLERVLALKLLSHRKGISPKAKARFLREIKITARLEHPNIIPVYDGGYLDGDMPYYAMKELKGGTLKDFLKDTPEEEREALRPVLLDIYLKVCDAIEYAHFEGVIHRDLKPSNIAVGDFGEVIVMDWGIAKCQGMEDLEIEESQRNLRLSSISQDDLTLEGDILGTPGYLSPEQARGEDADKRSDIFALGAILYEILCFSNPFQGNPQKKIMATLMEEPKAPHLMAPHLNIPGELSSITMKALTKDKYKRYQKVDQLKEDIFRYRAGFGVSASRDSLRKQILRAMKRHKGTVLASAACFLAVLLSLAFVKWWDINQKKGKVLEYTRQADKNLQSSRLKEAREIASSRNGKINLAMERKIERAIEIYSKARDDLERALQINLKDKTLRKKLYDVEKWIGILSLKIHNYLLAKSSFERCQKLFPDQKEDELIERVEKERKALHESQKTRLRTIMDALDKGPPEPGMMDEYITEVVKMNSSEVVQVLLGYLYKPNEWQRKLAIEALGKIGDRNTQWEGKEVGQWLMDRLTTLEPRKDVDEAVSIVWALGRLRYGPANERVFEMRQKHQDTPFYHRTALPYRWIPSSHSRKSSGEKEKWDQKGAMAMLKGDFKEAIRYYKMGIAQKPKDFIRYFLYGDALLKMGKPQEAIENFNKALELKDTLPKGYLLRGSAWLNLGDLDKALKDFQKALSLNQKDSEIYGHLGVYWTKKGNHEKALLCFDKALALNANSDLYYKNRAELHRRIGKFDKALQDCNQALALNPKNAEAHHIRGLVFQNTGKADKAIEAFNQAIALNPKNNGFYNSRGSYYFSIKKNAEALENFEKSISLNPRDFRVHSNIGILYMTQKKFPEALVALSQSIEINKNFPIPYKFTGLVYMQMNKAKEAVPYLEKYLQSEKKDLQIYRCLGICYQALNRPKEALAALQKALDLDPKDPALQNTLGDLHMNTKNFSEALKCYNRAIHLNPNLAEPFVGRGRILYMAKKYPESLASFNQAMALKNTMAFPYFGRGLVRIKLGQKKLALQDFQKFLQRAPRDPRANIAKKLIKELTK